MKVAKMADFKAVSSTGMTGMTGMHVINIIIVNYGTPRQYLKGVPPLVNEFRLS